MITTIKAITLSINICWPLWAGTVLSSPQALSTWLSQGPSEAGILSPSHWRGNWGLKKWSKLWASKPRSSPFPQPRTGEPVWSRGVRWAAWIQQICRLVDKRARYGKTRHWEATLAPAGFPAPSSSPPGGPLTGTEVSPYSLAVVSLCYFQSITKTRGSTAERKRVCSVSSLLMASNYFCTSVHPSAVQPFGFKGNRPNPQLWGPIWTGQGQSAPISPLIPFNGPGRGSWQVDLNRFRGRTLIGRQALSLPHAPFPH